MENNPQNLKKIRLKLLKDLLNSAENKEILAFFDEILLKIKEKKLEIPENYEPKPDNYQKTKDYDL